MPREWLSEKDYKHQQAGQFNVDRLNLQKQVEKANADFWEILNWQALVRVNNDEQMVRAQDAVRKMNRNLAPNHPERVRTQKEVEQLQGAVEKTIMIKDGKGKEIPTVCISFIVPFNRGNELIRHLTGQVVSVRKYRCEPQQAQAPKQLVPDDAENQEIAGLIDDEAVGLKIKRRKDDMDWETRMMRNGIRLMRQNHPEQRHRGEEFWMPKWDSVMDDPPFEFRKRE